MWYLYVFCMCIVCICVYMCACIRLLHGDRYWKCVVSKIHHKSRLSLTLSLSLSLSLSLYPLDHRWDPWLSGLSWACLWYLWLHFQALSLHTAWEVHGWPCSMGSGRESKFTHVSRQNWGVYFIFYGMFILCEFFSFFSLSLSNWRTHWLNLVTPGSSILEMGHSMVQRSVSHQQRREA